MFLKFNVAVCLTIQFTFNNGCTRHYQHKCIINANPVLPSGNLSQQKMYFMEVKYQEKAQLSMKTKLDHKSSTHTMYVFQLLCVRNKWWKYNWLRTRFNLSIPKIRLLVLFNMFNGHDSFSVSNFTRTSTFKLVYVSPYSQFFFVIQVTNKGTGHVANSTLWIYWPYEVESGYNEGKHLLYLMEEPRVSVCLLLSCVVHLVLMLKDLFYNYAFMVWMNEWVRMSVQAIFCFLFHIFYSSLIAWDMYTCNHVAFVFFPQNSTESHLKG